MAYQKVYMNQIHSSSLLCQLSQMWRGEILCDAFIRTGNITSKAHRVVLVAACPMLQSMDGAAIGSQLEVKLSADIKKDSVTAFLQYLYEGFMMLTEDNVKDVEKIARLLQVDGVIKCCSDFHRNLKKSTGRSVVPDAQLRYTYADQAEFKHVRTSDLLRSMNNTEKRGSEMDDSGRKRFRGGQYSVTDDSLSMMSSYSSLGSDTQRPQQPPRFKQRQVLEDSFELVQTELDTTPGSQGRPLPGRPPTTVSVTVASRVNPDPDVQIVCLPETVEQGARQSSSTSFSPFSPNRSASNFNFGSNLPGSSRKNSTQSIPSPGSTAVPKHVRQVIQSSSSLQNIPRDSSSISSPSMPSPSHLSKSGPSSVLSDDGRSKDADPTDQIVVQPTSLEASQMSTSPLPEFSNANIESVTGGTSLDASSLSPSARKNSQETKPGVAVPSGSFDDPGDSSRHSMAPDLSIVKIERAAEQPSTSSGAQGPDTGGLDMHVEMQGGDIEDYEPIDDDGEEDTSEMEMWNYGDMSGKFANDPANAMYIQGQDSGDGSGMYTMGPGGAGLGGASPMGRPSVGRSIQMDYANYGFKQFGRNKRTLQQKIVRALCLSKSPIEYLRPLQRKIGKITIDVLKEECLILQSTGFGHLGLKSDMRNYLQRDAFMKPSPDLLGKGHPMLVAAMVDYDTYVSNFDNLSELSLEEQRIVCNSHPDTEYIQKHCIFTHQGVYQRSAAVLAEASQGSNLSDVRPDTSFEAPVRVDGPDVKSEALSHPPEHSTHEGFSSPAMTASELILSREFLTPKVPSLSDFSPFSSMPK